MTPLRVLWIIKGLGPGGAERLLVSIARASDRAKVSYEAAYVLPWKDHLVAELTDSGVPCHLIGGRRGLADARWVARARRLARGADVVCMHSPAIASAMRPVVRTMSRRPALVSIDHNAWTSYGRVTRLLNRATIGLDDAHLAVSEEVRASMSARARRHTRVVVHGVPVDAIEGRRHEREERRAALGLRPDEIVVTTVANLRRTKDYPTLFRAAAEVVARDPRAVFLAAGQGPLEAVLREELAQLGLGDRFRMLGYVDDAIGLLSASDLFVLASQVEGLPIAVLEAMALGLPVVATAVGGTPTAVDDAVTGRLVPAGDPGALAAAIRGLIDDEPARRAFGATGAARARDFDIARAARELESIYENVRR